MFSQVQLFVLIVLVAGLQCSPAPCKYCMDTDWFGMRGLTRAQAHANVKGSLSNGLADGKGSLDLGAGDNIYELAGEYHMSDGGWINPKWNGRAGKNADGKLTGGAGVISGGKNTNEDALIKFNDHYYSRTAADILREMDDDNYYD